MRARSFVISRTTGQPVAGAPITAKARQGGVVTTLAMLASDDVGYVSFDLPDDQEWSDVWLEAVGDPQARSFLLTSGDVGKTKADGSKGEGNGNRTAPAKPTEDTVDFDRTVSVLQVDPAILSLERSSTLPSIQGSPDARDYSLSPASFLTPRKIKIGDRDCAIPVRSNMPVHTVRFTQIVRRPAQPRTREVQEGREPADRDQRGTSAPVLDLFDDPKAQPNLKVLACDILEYEQQWFDLGETLGTILYSLPLAPCESVDIAVIEASRSDDVARTDSAAAGEHLEHSLFRDRGITDSVDGALKESQGGWSFMAGHGGAYSGSFPIGNFGATHAIGYGTSRSWGERKLHGESAQDLHDSTVQSTDLVRSLNSTVIVHGTQAERHQLQTRTITNHNHSHAMTVQYYEVLRRLRLQTRFVRTRPGVLVPYRGLTFTTARPTVSWIGDLVQLWKITDPERKELHLVNRVRPMLLDDLLEPRLRENFDAVRRLLFFDATLPPQYLPGDPGDYTITGLKLTLRRGQWGTGADTVSMQLMVDDQHGVEFAQPIEPHNKVYADRPILRDKGWWGDDSAFEDEPRPLGPFTFRLKSPTARSRLKEFRILWEPEGVDDDLSLKGLKAVALKADGSEDVLVDESVNRVFTKENAVRFERFPIKPVPSPEEAGPDVSTAAAYARRSQDVALAWELITHLNDHRDHYSQFLASVKDPSWFADALDAEFGSSGSIRDSIDAVPVAVCGHHLAFPFNPSEQPSAQPAPAAPEPTIVSLPTRGVFAEVQLSSCNASEKRDITRLWNWQEQAQCERPPSIEGVSPGFRGQAPGVEPAQLPNAVVQITQPPAAPDPVGLAAALQLLGRPDIFRDMSGLQQVSDLLDDLVNGAVSGAEAASRAASARNALPADPASNGRGGGMNRSAPSTPSPQRQVDALDAIKYAQEQGLIDEQQGNNAAVGVLGGEPLAGVELAAEILPDLRAWESLLRFRVPATIQDALRPRDIHVQVFSEALGPISLDYLPVHITKLPTVGSKQLTPAELLRTVRLGMTGPSPIFVNPSYSTFEPYAARDKTKWESSDPAGSVIFINIPGFDNASVVLSAINQEQWIFSTVYANEDRPGGKPQQHPVSGNRQFGIKPTESGSWIFYTRGADRTSGFLESIGSGITFNLADMLWFSLQERVEAWVRAHGGAAQALPKEGGRYRWARVRDTLGLPVEI
ncbi:hypothetical protein EDD27_3198 [Nonomuraea polychroma]|uniref:Uncharacterized protein n=1 Tax=Nonomuraea polychroma TaxID=46176 RepID=A0A438M5U4_9ACTN|nr:hypothetical protein EDD27_3198 [Nonomuraea polychroma]